MSGHVSGDAPSQQTWSALNKALGPGHDVSRETRERLTAFIVLLKRWQKVQNLVSARTLTDVWTRHIVDSAQLLPLAGHFAKWVDLGSGAGFPGAVIAILCAEDRSRRFHLVEANGRKVAFLREVSRQLDIPMDIHRHRIEDIVESAQFAGTDIVSARALAPLPELICLSAPLFSPQTRGLFPKGEAVESELDAARHVASFRATRHSSCTNDQASIIELSEVKLIQLGQG